MSEHWPDERIRTSLPHRHEMLLCPAATIDAAGARGEATLRVPAGAWMLRLGMPHLYLLEALGQLSGLVLAAARPAGREPLARGYLAEIPVARLGRSPRPGEEIRLVVARTVGFGALHRFRVGARAAGETLVDGELTIATS